LEGLGLYGYGALSEEDCAIIGSLPRLTQLTVPGTLPISNLPLLLSAPALATLSVGERLKPEDGEVLNRFPRLSGLTMSGDGTDSLLGHLRDLDQLESLNMSGTTVSAAALATLNERLKNTLAELSFGKPDDESSEVAAFAFERFSKLKKINLRGEISAAAFSGIAKLDGLDFAVFNNAGLTSSHIKAIGTLRELSELTIGGGTLSVDNLAALSRLKSLTRLLIKDNGIKLAPEAISEFAKLDTLTTLELPESQTTEVQLAALKKALPKCAISRVRAYQ